MVDCQYLSFQTFHHMASKQVGFFSHHPVRFCKRKSGRVITCRQRDYAARFGQNPNLHLYSHQQAVPRGPPHCHGKPVILLLSFFAHPASERISLSRLLYTSSTHPWLWRVFSARGFTSAMTQTPPAMTVAFGWAPDMPPSPEVTKSLPARSPLRFPLTFRPALRTVMAVPWTMPWGPI